MNSVSKNAVAVQATSLSWSIVYARISKKQALMPLEELARKSENKRAKGRERELLHSMSLIEDASARCSHN